MVYLNSLSVPSNPQAINTVYSPNLLIFVYLHCILWFFSSANFSLSVRHGFVIDSPGIPLFFG